MLPLRKTEWSLHSFCNFLRLYDYFQIKCFKKKKVSRLLFQKPQTVCIKRHQSLKETGNHFGALSSQRWSAIHCLSSNQHLPSVSWESGLVLEAKWYKMNDLWSISMRSQPNANCCSATKSCPTLCDPLDCSILGLSVTVSWGLPKFMSIDSVMLSNHSMLIKMPNMIRALD